MRKEKTEQVVLTFYTTAEAIATERLCKSLAIEGKLFPAPRALSADCGIAWCSPAAERERLLTAIKDAAIEVHGVHEMLL